MSSYRYNLEQTLEKIQARKYFLKWHEYEPTEDMCDGHCGQCLSCLYVKADKQAVELARIYGQGPVQEYKVLCPNGEVILVWI